MKYAIDDSLVKYVLGEIEVRVVLKAWYEIILVNSLLINVLINFFF